MEQGTQLYSVLQYAGDPILMFDAEGRLLFLNFAGQQLLSDPHVGSGQRLRAGAGYDAFLELLDSACRSHSSLSGEVVWPDNRIFSASITMVPQGGCLAILHNVSQYKEREKVKNEFIASASHDLRSPITSIQGFNVLLKQAGPLNEMQREFITRIQAATETMQELVEDLLDLTNMELGAEQRFEALNVSSLIWELADEFQPQAEANTQLLAVGRTEPRSFVRGDALRIRQALRNLVWNALKYTPNGGVVMLSIEHRSDMACIHITDTGYGIPTGDLPHIFNRFYRVRNHGQSGIKGHGLGLAIVKSIADSHGGEVTVQSEVGKGSCFTFKLPLVPGEMLTLDHPSSVEVDFHS